MARKKTLRKGTKEVTIMVTQTEWKKILEWDEVFKSGSPEKALREMLNLAYEKEEAESD